MAIADTRTPRTTTKIVRCAIYTRKSTEEGLDQEYNTLDAQRDSAEAFIRSQRHEGWVALPERYDDGGYTGANMDRPALKRLLDDVRAGLIDCVMVYKVDRLTRALLDFSRIVEVLDKHGVSFVSVTQQFNTTSSLGRLTLNILLSFAQFEREMISERTRDKMSAARRKGRWIGGHIPLGYDLAEKGGALVVNPDEAARVREIFRLYLEYGSLIPTVQDLNNRGWRLKQWATRRGTPTGGREFTKNRLYNLLTNRVYVGKVDFGDQIYEGEHEGIVDPAVWQSVQDRLRHNARTGGREVRNKYGALLKGILKCASCQTGMSHTYTQKSANKLYRYYVCVTAHQKGYSECPTRSVSAPAVEQAVIDQIRGISRNPVIVSAVLQELEDGRAANIESLQRERRLVEKELGRISDEIAGLMNLGGRSATDRLAELQERATAQEAKLRDIRGQLAATAGAAVDAASVRQAMEQFDGLWAETSPREQERFVKTLVEGVLYNGETAEVTVGFRTKGIRNFCMQGGIQ